MGVGEDWESPNKWLNARKKLLCARKCAVSAWKPAAYARNEPLSARNPAAGRRMARIWSGQVQENLLINGLTPERSCYAPGNAPYPPENQRHTPGTSRHPPAKPWPGGGWTRIWSGKVQGESPNKWLNARKKLLCARKCAVSA